MSDEQAAEAGVLRNTLVVLRKSLGEASTALEYQQVRAKKVEEYIASYQEQAAEHVRVSTVESENKLSKFVLTPIKKS